MSHDRHQLTVAIASFQRRDPLLRLLEALEPEVTSSAPGNLIRVVVVDDGSTDGTAHAARNLGVPYPLDVVSVSHSGLARARNVGLEHAGNGLVLFLDDDLVPGPGLLGRHLAFHREHPGSVLLGPCRPAPGSDGGKAWSDWWTTRWQELEDAGRISRFDQFTLANASGAASLFRSVGGVDESFTGYGVEDYELGVRLLDCGVPIAYLGDAEAWHHHHEDEWTAVRRQRSLGRNMVRLVQRHPDLLETALPVRHRNLALRLVAAVRPRAPVTLGAVATAAAFAALRHPELLAGRTATALEVAHVAAFAAGVAEGDRALVGRVVGSSH